MTGAQERKRERVSQTLSCSVPVKRIGERESESNFICHITILFFLLFYFQFFSFSYSIVVLSGISLLVWMIQRGNDVSHTLYDAAMLVVLKAEMKKKLRQKKVFFFFLPDCEQQEKKGKEKQSTQHTAYKIYFLVAFVAVFLFFFFSGKKTVLF